ncbi:MAG TPA: BON domain-containing protein [Vicinamibacteria bacterium]|nr:BON domain-containing protein [Vicinamibacteria bacterium]
MPGKPGVSFVVLRALLRTFFRGILVLFLVAVFGSLYYLYRSGQLPYVQEAVEDAAVVGSVKAAYALNRDLAERAIRVEARSGNVILRGTVGTESEKSQAASIAESIEGVRSVENLLETDPGLTPKSQSSRSLGEAIDDAALLAKVRTALRLDKGTRPLPLEVSVRGGTVVLAGRVPSEDLRKRVLERVASVSGVEKVDDQMRLE